MRRGDQGLRAALALGALALALATPGHADDLRARAGTVVHVESMDTTILSTWAGAGARVPGEVDLDVSWNADVISSASVDVIAAATRGIEETRHEFALGATRAGLIDENLDVDASYAYTFERDTWAHIGHAGVRRKLLEEQLVLGADYGLTYNRIGLVGEPGAEWRPLWVHSLDLSAAYLLDPRTMVEVMYSGGLADGYLASRYRRVPITWRQDLRGAAWVEEAVPDQRIRHAATLRGQRALGSRWIASAEYRFYADDWGVVGHTVGLGVSLDVTPDLTVAVRARGAQQSGASFYRERYEVLQEYRTRDRRLSPHLSGLLGVAVTWNLGELIDWETLEITAGGEGVAHSFQDFLAPQLDLLGGAEWRTLGVIEGVRAYVELQVRP